MKRTVTLLFGLLFSLNLFGQYVNYETDSRWFMGVNVGGTWNTTDVENKTYAGWGLIFGKSFNYNYGRVLSYDLRARYLRGKWYGQDYDTTNLSHLGADYSGALSAYKDSFGYSVNNFESDVHELGLEFAIHLNRLRERTGIDPYIFAGANVVWNQSYGDLYSQDTLLGGPGQLYNYDPSNITKSSLNSTLDGIFETPLDGTKQSGYNVNFMPSLGFGIGYHFGPHFSVGLEHKTTFTLRDDFDGFVDDTPRGKFGFTNDVYHYTSGYMRFHIRGGRTGAPSNNNNSNTNNLTGGGCQDPVIILTQPDNASSDVTNSELMFRAKVSHVVGRENITLRVNGNVTTNFLYDATTDKLESYLILAPGMNTVQITAGNGCGSETQNYTINYVNCIAPELRFTSPSHNNFQVSQAQFDVRANVQRADNVTFKFNGISSSSFFFNSANGSFQSSVALQNGVNTIEVAATNECGTTTETITVNLTDCTDPSIVFLNSNTNNVQSTTEEFAFKAQVLHIEGRGNIGFRLNGVNQTFTYDSDAKYLNAGLKLRQGSNTIQITATNDCGTETETFTVDYSPCVAPYIQMIDPAGNGIQTTSANYLVKAKVYEVNTLSQIQLIVNGTVISGGQFNNVTKVFQKTVSLQMGQNEIKLVATTDCGTDMEIVKIIRVREQSDEKITICHRPPGNPNNMQTLEIPLSAWPAHQAHGDVLGPCPEVEEPNNEKVTICHHPPGNPGNTQTLEIPLSAWPAHQAHGDVLGPCPVEEDHSNEKVTICHRPPGNPNNTQTLEIPLSAWPAHQAHGDVLGPCPEIEDPEPINEEGNAGNEKITICHHPPGNPNNTQTLEIPLSAWPAHQAHGDVLGPCPEIEDPEPINEEGNAGNEKITICHHPPGNPENTQTLEIPLSAWPAHQAHGDVLGPCSEIEDPEPSNEEGNNGNEGEGTEKITICHRPPGNRGNVQTLEIPLSAWPAHQAHGDVLGPCPEENDNGGNEGGESGTNGNSGTQGSTNGEIQNENGFGSGGTIGGGGSGRGGRGGNSVNQLGLSSGTITICHNVPGKEGVTETLVIDPSEWPLHKAHGDKMGPCDDQNKENGEPGKGEADQGNNGNSGSEGEKITICHHPPGKPDQMETIEISLTAWPAHQAHGCTLGPCEDEQQTGVNNETIQNEDGFGSNSGSEGSSGLTGTNNETIQNEDGFGGSGTVGGSNGGGTGGTTGGDNGTIQNEDGFGSGTTIGGGSNMTISNEPIESTSEELKSSGTEESATKKAVEEAAAKRAAEEAARKKAAEEAAVKRAAEEAARKKAAEEAAAKRAAEEAARKKAAEEAAAKRAAEEAARKKATEEKTKEEKNKENKPERKGGK